MEQADERPARCCERFEQRVNVSFVLLPGAWQSSQLSSLCTAVWFFCITKHVFWYDCVVSSLKLFFFLVCESLIVEPAEGVRDGWGRGEGVSSSCQSLTVLLVEESFFLTKSWYPMSVQKQRKLSSGGVKGGLVERLEVIETKLCCGFQGDCFQTCINKVIAVPGERWYRCCYHLPHLGTCLPPSATQPPQLSCCHFDVCIMHKIATNHYSSTFICLEGTRYRQKKGQTK